MYTKLTQAHKRPLTGKERLGLLVFVLKFLLSKFGIFLFFLSLNAAGTRAWKEIPQIPPNQRTVLQQNRPESQAILLEGSSRVHESHFGSPSEAFSKLKIYCILATIVSIFLNPQQTKYFGGLAVALKQAGLFSKYGKSEKTVYVLSWILIFLFVSMSYVEVLNESLEGTIKLPKIEHSSKS